MALALYRKYRPATFAEVVGQEHVTEPLRTALAAGRVNHAYLFSGPRGCGKTSSARIMARSLNCERGPTPDPCGVCNSCVNLAPEGAGSVDVVELDAASHGGVDDTRELRDRAFYAPAESRYRVFIIDEAHMVTTQGFNALLKIVEEPPEHLIFIFATTEPEKVLGTIRSRTHHYPFRLIPPGAMRALIERNCVAEGVSVEPAVFPLVIRAGGGSARDTQSVLDQLLAGAGPGGVTYDRAIALLGVTDVALIDDAVDALAAGDGAEVFGVIDRLVEAGHDPRRFAADLLDRLRDLVLLAALPEAAQRGLIDVPEEQLTRMSAQVERLGPGTLTRFAEIVHTGLTEMRGATAPRLVLELLCARMLLPSVSDAESALLQRLERLELRATVVAPVSAAEAGLPAAVAQAPAAQAPAVPAPAVQAAGAPAGDRPTFQRRSRQPEAPAAESPAQAPPAQQRPAQPPAAAAPSAPPPAEAPAQRPAAPAEPPAASWPATHSAETQDSAPPAAQPGVPAAAPTVAAGGLDAAALRRVWSELLAAVRGKSRSTEAMLTNATVQSVDGETVVLTHTAEPLARRLSDSRNAEVIAEALTSVVGGRWRVTCVHGDAAPAAPSGGNGAARPAQPKQPLTRPSQGNRPVAEPAPAPAPAPAPLPEPDIPLPPEPDEPEDTETMIAESTALDESVVIRNNHEESTIALVTQHLGARRIEKG
ncbi:MULTISPECIES: DNA polymerase III subunit gamma and tau [unclassified Crossiella]|uniref:DNA polymerase III subunit gamma and tau n=1 Tax=unclassified Crossiella TaxID=2620835 RepID=UPI001FFEA1F7|nr:MULTISPECIES: DNA polymerase III subunit gamma and tau [unclassified Crossiella]MCK2237598.1 DNA polymerase III subunit gamma and tau [Crossiella sp. S99.2]MCK2254884.1 DNA polymerase III subunit gamma and tau [Crossiella sp. S99.1]